MKLFFNKILTILTHHLLTFVIGRGKFNKNFQLSSHCETKQTDWNRFHGWIEVVVRLYGFCGLFFSRNFKTWLGRCGKHGVKFHLQLFAKLSINPEVVQFMINYICKENTLLSYFCHISCNVSGFNAIFGLFILSFFHFDSQKRILIGVQTLLV